VLFQTSRAISVSPESHQSAQTCTQVMIPVSVRWWDDTTLCMSHWNEWPVCSCRDKTGKPATRSHLCRVAVLTASFSHNFLDLNTVTTDHQSDVKAYYLSSLHIRIWPVLEGIFFTA